MSCLNPPVAHNGIAISCKRKLLGKNLRMRKNLAKWLPYRICKESVAFALFTTCDLSIGDLAIESLDVRVIHCNSARSASSNGPRLILSFFGIKEFCRPCSCRRLARIFVVVLICCLAFIGPAGRSSSLHANVMVLSYRCQGAV